MRDSHSTLDKMLTGKPRQSTSMDMRESFRYAIGWNKPRPLPPDNCKKHHQCTRSSNSFRCVVIYIYIIYVQFIRYFWQFCGLARNFRFLTRYSFFRIIYWQVPCLVTWTWAIQHFEVLLPTAGHRWVALNLLPRHTLCSTYKSLRSEITTVIWPLTTKTKRILGDRRNQTVFGKLQWCITHQRVT
jgi:hypothetical protein